MYSVVLMMALTNGAEMPAFGGGCRGGRGCRGCSGCSGSCGGCYGGYGGCHGGGYGGCYGGGYGGGYGGCYGGGGYGGMSCHGGGYGGGYGGCYGGGGYGGMSCSGGQSVAPVMSSVVPQGLPSGVANGSAPATIVVSLPAGATLTIDDTPTSSTSASRVFQTPPLERGYEYYYQLKAEAMRDGQKVQVTNRITVRAGEATSVRLEFPVANVASK